MPLGLMFGRGGPPLSRAISSRSAATTLCSSARSSQRRLKKGASLLNAVGQLARLDPRTNTVERRTNLSHEEFRDRYYAANRPVVIQGLMAGWRAMTAWTPDYLKSVADDRMIEVMTGRNADPKYEMNPRKHRTEMRFADYIMAVIEQADHLALGNEDAERAQQRHQSRRRGLALMVLGEHEAASSGPKWPSMPAGSGAVSMRPSAASQRSRRKSTT
jgi:hypothetical protein